MGINDNEPSIVDHHSHGSLELAEGDPQPFFQMSEEAIQREERKISRVTVRLSAARERSFENSQPFPVGDFMGFEIPIPHDKPAFVMDETLKVGEKPFKVESYWVEDPKVMFIQNSTKWKSAKQPTEEQIEGIKNSILEIGFNGTDFPLIVHPKRTQMLMLTSSQEVYVRAISGTPSVTIFST